MEPQTIFLKDAKLEDFSSEEKKIAWNIVSMFYQLKTQEKIKQGDFCFYDLLINPSPDSDTSIPSNITDLSLALRWFDSNYRPEVNSPTFVDLGSNDGRVVLFAALLDYSAYGFENNRNSFELGSIYADHLHQAIGGQILRKGGLVFGDYTQRETYAQAMIYPEQIDVFFNYEDGNIDKVASVLKEFGKPGARLLLHTFDDYTLKLKDTGLEHICSINSDDSLSVFSVYEKE